MTRAVSFLLMAAAAGAVVGMLTAPSQAVAQERRGERACVKHLREVGGPDARNGIKVLRSSWSEAGTLVTMRDAGGTTWRCIGYQDGTIGEMAVINAADDGGGATAGSGAGHSEGTTRTQRVHFVTGTTGATYDGSLTPGSTVRYVLGARDGQFLDVKVHHKGGRMSYQIWNPDGSFLLEMIAAKTPYRGQLWQSGDHVVELINRGKKTETYRVSLEIK